MANGKNKGGRPKGAKNKATLDKEAAREALREIVKARLLPMTNAQCDAAEGIKHLMFRDPKTGKFERVKDEEGMDVALASEGEAVWIYTKDPATAAFTDLLNRTLDKPADHVEANVRGVLTVKWEGE